MVVVRRPWKSQTWAQPLVMEGPPLKEGPPSKWRSHTRRVQVWQQLELTAPRKAWKVVQTLLLLLLLTLALRRAR